MSKNRPLKGKGKRDGTPDKSAGGLEESKDESDLANKKPVIYDESIGKLRITEEELLKVLSTEKLSEVAQLPTSTIHVAVRKEIPVSERKPPTKRIGILKRAPADAPLLIDDCNGPRFNSTGHVIQHSILGSVEDYYRIGLRKGEITPDEIPREYRAQLGTSSPSGQLSFRAPKPANQPRLPPSGIGACTYPRTDYGQDPETSALRNWEEKMRKRRQLVNNLSKQLNRSPDHLVLISGDNYRTVQEERHLIDRTIPYIGYGKGFRVGSEYWKQREVVGVDEDNAVHVTLTQTEKGYPPSIEHVGHPNVTRTEKGMCWISTDTPRYPWHLPYYQTRRAQLDPLISELDPHMPQFDDLAIVGRSVPPAPAATSGYHGPIVATAGENWNQEPREIVVQDIDQEEEEDSQVLLTTGSCPILGPSLLFGGQPARWAGSATACLGRVGIEARVIFQCRTEEKCVEHLDIINDGTAVIRYRWKKLEQANPFELVQPKVRRFYFNIQDGNLLPGETLHFPFIFKSVKGGIFTEQWCLETSPVVCGGAMLLVTLRGIALREDVHARQREAIETQLCKESAEKYVRSLLDEIISGLQIPERPRTPIDSYLTEEEIFRRKNPNWQYTTDSMKRLQQFHTETLRPGDPAAGTVPQWDNTVVSLRGLILENDQPKFNYDESYKKLNTILTRITFTIPFPTRQQSDELYRICYRTWLETLMQLFDEWSTLRTSHGLPDLEMILPEQTARGKRGATLAGGKSKSTMSVKDSKPGGIGAQSGKTSRPDTKSSGSIGTKSAVPGPANTAAGGKKPSVGRQQMGTREATTDLLLDPEMTSDMRYESVSPGPPMLGQEGMSSPTLPDQGGQGLGEESLAAEHQWRGEAHSLTFAMLASMVERLVDSWNNWTEV